MRSTRQWVQDFVVGYRLCPFAERVFSTETVQYRVSLETDRTRIIERFKLEVYPPNRYSSSLLCLMYCLTAGVGADASAGRGGCHHFVDATVRLPRLPAVPRLLSGSGGLGATFSGAAQHTTELSFEQWRWRAKQRNTGIVSYSEFSASLN